jgi:DNA-binding MarR family transcriptional regulator
MTVEETIHLFLARAKEREEQAIKASELGDFTEHQLSCLKKIEDLKHPLPSVLAGEMFITKPTMTALIDKLLKKKVIRKVPSQKDKRAFHLHLTGTGKKMLQLHESVQTGVIKEFTENLSESEKDILGYLLSKVLNET